MKKKRYRKIIKNIFHRKWPNDGNDPEKTKKNKQMNK
jgi:hypothetical protein